MPQRTVTRVFPSPMNKRRWCLDLDCGHEVWITAGRKPKRSTAECERCKATPATGPLRVRFIDPDYRRKSIPKADYCGRCMKDLKPDQPFRLARLVHGGAFALHPDDEPRYMPGCDLLFEDGETRTCQGDAGACKIGHECVRKIGAEWTRQPDAR